MDLVLKLVTGTHKPTDAGNLTPGSCAVYAILEVSLCARAVVVVLLLLDDFMNNS